MARKKREVSEVNEVNEVALYRANSRRAEAGGIGIVEAGQEVDLSPLGARAIAHLVFNGYYAPTGDIPEDVAQYIADFKAG